MSVCLCVCLTNDLVIYNNVLLMTTARDQSRPEHSIVVLQYYHQKTFSKTKTQQGQARAESSSDDDVVELMSEVGRIIS